MGEPNLGQLNIRSINSGGYAAGWVLEPGGTPLMSINPATGRSIATVVQATCATLELAIGSAAEAFERWRQVPAPKRGEMIYEIGSALRRHKQALGSLVTLETGKILAEGEGEVQEMIDICDFAVGLSRQLYGKTMHSERAGHRMYEQWQPLGVVGIVTAFNFPVAVWAWNAMIAAVCGNAMVWKPSPKTPLTAIAVQNIIEPILKRYRFAGLMNLVIGDLDQVGKPLVRDSRVGLISATGSTEMGRDVAQVVAGRFGKTILELGGNNAVIVLADADLKLAERAILFGALGTAGQRCTTIRRLLLARDIAEPFIQRLKTAYSQVVIGDPCGSTVLMGPLIDRDAVDRMGDVLRLAVAQGAEIVYGGEAFSPPGCEGGYFVRPALVRADPALPIVKQETFAPILYLMPVDSLVEAITIQNDVPQGLSSAIFTRSLQAAEQFLSAVGSDCGIANVNMGTSGAEIGGAFGGEKETGGGREAGSDAWKAYMRRQTSTINFSDQLPLAQGINFSSGS